jgi:hypothetical protein
MHGGPSHVDLFDPKPELVKLGGQPLPESFGAVMTRRKVADNPLLGPIKPFKPRGESGCRRLDREGLDSMAKTSATQPLTPQPAALRRALAKAADRAQRLADAFRLRVPVERAPVKRAKRATQGPKPRT